MAKFKTVLFDFDGTIMDTYKAIMQSWQHTFRTVEGRERPADKIIGIFGEPLDVTMKKVLPQIPVEAGLEIYKNYHYDNFAELIGVFPGIIDLLHDLKAGGYKTGIITSRLRHTTEIGLKKYNMEQYFDVVMTCEDTEKHKPDPEPVNAALERLGSRPEEAVMVGDTLADIQCARNAGVKAVLVGWSWTAGDKEKSSESAPDYIIERAEDLLSILECS